jgi:glycosyltransferase involved in cell wall biosynthesis
MKALVIAPQPFFSPRGTPFSVYYRTKVSTELGVGIDLLTYGQGQDVDIPGVRIIRIPAFKWLGPIKIGPSPLKLFLDFFLVLWTLALLITNRYDVVHAHEEAVFFCLLLKPIFRFKLIYDMHSSLPEQLDNFKFTGARLFVGLFTRLERASLNSAEAVITICPALADQALKLLKDKSKHYLIENSIFDPVQLKPVRLKGQTGDKQNPAGGSGRTPEPPEGKRLVVYAGTLEPYQGIDLLIRGFKTAAAQEPEAFLVIVGGNRDQVEHFKELAGQLGLDQEVLFCGRVDPDTARGYTRRAEVLVSPRVSGTNTPLKIYEQLASGKPLVATKIYSHTQVLDDKVAFLVEPKPEEVGRGILAALADDGRPQQVAAGAEELYRTRYAPAVYREKLGRLLKGLG